MAKNSVKLYTDDVLTAFYDAIKNNTLPDVSLEDGLMSVAIGQAAELSIKENRVVKMSEFNL